MLTTAYAKFLLVLNCFFEAAGEPIAGKIAVTASVYNRAKICNEPTSTIILASKQYSWTTGKGDGDMKISISNLASIRGVSECLAAVEHVDRTGEMAGGALYYHSISMKKYPQWSGYKMRLYSIGGHVFYTEHNAEDYGKCHTSFVAGKANGIRTRPPPR